MNLISIRDLSIEDINNIVYGHIGWEDRAIPQVGILFLEPSTRTKYSFISAINLLGWRYIDFANETMSTKKGESIEDTLRMCLAYVDILVIRSSSKTLVYKAVEISKKEFSNEKIIINGGNGINEHPTQAILDYKIMLEHCPDPSMIKPKFFYKAPYRAVNSLQYLLEMVNGYNKNDVMTTEEINFIYVGRGYTGLIDNNILHKYPNAYIMHPLPRNEELSKELDGNERSIYFSQAENGPFVRASLMRYLMNN